MKNFSVKFLAVDGTELTVKVSASTRAVAISCAMNAGWRDKTLPLEIELVEVTPEGAR